MPLYTPRLIEPGPNAFQAAGSELRNIGALILGMDAERKERERLAEAARRQQEQFDAQMGLQREQFEEDRRMRNLDLETRGIVPVNRAADMAEDANRALENIDALTVPMPGVTSAGPSLPSSIGRTIREGRPTFGGGDWRYDPSRDVGRMREEAEYQRRRSDALEDMERQFQQQRDLLTAPRWTPPREGTLQLNEEGEYVLIDPVTGETRRTGEFAPGGRRVGLSGSGGGTGGTAVPGNWDDIFNQVRVLHGDLPLQEQVRITDALVAGHYGVDIPTPAAGEERAGLDFSWIGDLGRKILNAPTDPSLQVGVGASTAPPSVELPPPGAEVGFGGDMSSQDVGGFTRAELDEAAEHYRWLPPDERIAAMQEDGATPEAIEYMLQRIEGR